MKFFQISLLVLSFYSCDSQEHNYKKDDVRQGNQQAKDKNPSVNDKVINKEVDVYGRWKCVAVDTRGYQKFTSKEALQLEKSILNIEPKKMYYTGVAFVDPCNFDTLLRRHDLSNDDWSGTSFMYRYTKADLSAMTEIDQVDKQGNPSCFNDCAGLFLKQDTLINICGGYTLFFTKDSGH